MRTGVWGQQGLIPSSGSPAAGVGYKVQVSCQVVTISSSFPGWAHVQLSYLTWPKVTADPSPGSSDHN